MSGISRGFGFASFSSKDAADTAIEMLNHKEYNGRLLKIKYDEPEKK